MTKVRMPRLGRRRVALLCLALAALSVALLPSAHATFKGPNGLLVYQAQVGRYTQLFTIRPDGTGMRQLTRFRDSGADWGAWSLDGKRLVFTRHWDPEGPNERIVLYTIGADGKGAKALPKGGDIAISPNWFPDGRRMIFLAIPSERLMVINANGKGLRPAGIPGVGGDSVCVLPNGKQVAFLRGNPSNGQQTAIFVAGLFGRGLKRITPWGTYADKLDCSPDGKRIVFSKPGFGQGGKSSNVYTMRTDGSDVVQLTHETGGAVNAGADSWSPDGTKIAYISNRSGTYQIWTMNTDGTGAAQLTRGPEARLAAWGSHP